MTETPQTPVVLEHILVPKHELAEEKEINELLAKHSITKHNLPWIKSTDPVVVALGAKIGDVVKIRRISPVTRKEAPYFRIVVE